MWLSTSAYSESRPAAKQRQGDSITVFCSSLTTTELWTRSSRRVGDHDVQAHPQRIQTDDRSPWPTMLTLPFDIIASFVYDLCPGMMYCTVRASVPCTWLVLDAYVHCSSASLSNQRLDVRVPALAAIPARVRLRAQCLCLVVDLNVGLDTRPLHLTCRYHEQPTQPRDALHALHILSHAHRTERVHTMKYSCASAAGASLNHRPHCL